MKQGLSLHSTNRLWQSIQKESVASVRNPGVCADRAATGLSGVGRRKTLTDLSRYRDETALGMTSKLIQETNFVLIKMTNVVDSMPHHAKPGDSQSERKTTDLVGIVSAG